MMRDRDDGGADEADSRACRQLLEQLDRRRRLTLPDEGARFPGPDGGSGE